MRCSHGQELGQLADLAFDWLCSVHSCAANQKPACLLIPLLTMTTTQKFPSLALLPVEDGRTQQTGGSAGVRGRQTTGHISH